MVNELNSGYRFYIYTSNSDLNGEPIAVAQVNEWLPFNEHTKVWYATNKNRSENLISQVAAIRPDWIYMIGMFSWHFTLVPLFYGRAPHKLLSVRGMLHPGALEQKSLKKKWFLQAMKTVGLTKKTIFHATDLVEQEHIASAFGPKAQVRVAANFPRLLTQQPAAAKEPGSLRLVSVGIVSPMKNYLLVLQALENVDATIEYNIYGPVKDAAYWETCLEQIKKLPANIVVHFHREIPTHKIPAKLEGQHVFILPSVSENYGHAIIEALSAGLPVITSQNLPWQGLEENKAGMNIEPSADTIADAITQFAAMNNETYSIYSQAAANYAREQVNLTELTAIYSSLFETTINDAAV
ncbi:MAG: hypothetical protein BGO53_00810 [Sphingobacteriales bacterium 39-19]|nr:MAG: hypothetical protein BGO53_00810 [Sphingobacteriales bacterium 39-19]